MASSARSVEQGRSFIDLVRTVTNCRKCFEPGGVCAPDINVAQPRWVGSNYWDSPFRVVILMINPGRSPKGSAGAKNYLRLIGEFRAGDRELRTILDGQREAMESWNRGRFTSFYIGGIGLKFDEIAFANVAWCATKTNTYPGWMLKDCFRDHTGPLLKLLDPHVVIASGKPVHGFEGEIRAMLPNTEVINALHYAHREGRVAQDIELRRLRSALEKYRSAAGASGRFSGRSAKGPVNRRVTEAVRLRVRQTRRA